MRAHFLFLRDNRGADGADGHTHHPNKSGY